MSCNKILNDNFAFLEAHSSEDTFKHLFGVIPADELKIKPEENGTLSFSLEKADGTSLHLHSRRDPLREAQRQVKSWLDSENPDTGGVVVVLGFAGMYHITEILKIMSPGSTLFVADIKPSLLKKSLEFIDLTSLSKDGVELHFSATPGSIHDEFRFQFRQALSPNVSFFTHPALFRAFPNEYSELKKSLFRETRLELMNRGTKIFYSGEWEQNAIENLPSTLSAPPLNNLKDSFKNMSAIICGAGPSLDSSIPYIKQVAGKSVIFSVGTAFKALLKAGIEPDFVVIVDSYPEVIKQLEGVPENSSFLLVSHHTLPGIFEYFPKRVFIFTLNLLSGFNEYLEKIDKLPDRLSAGGTVAVTAIDAAIYTGCRNIVFTGMDMAFDDDGSTHASESIYGGEKGQGKELFKVKGNYKDKVSTDKNMSVYIEMLRSYLHCESMENDIVFYNATDRGARLESSQLIMPEQITQLEFPSPDSKSGVIKKAVLSSGNDKAETLRCLNKTLDELFELEEAARSALEGTKKLFSGEASEKDIQRLEECEKIIRKENGAKLLISASMQVLFSDLGNMDPGTDNALKTELMEKKTQKLYSNIAAAAERAARTLKEAIGKYEKDES